MPTPRTPDKSAQSTDQAHTVAAAPRSCFDVHIYDETGGSFATAFSSLSAQGYQGVPWIIGEAFYNDAAEAASLRQQANSTGQKVLYLTEWPLTFDLNCSTDVNVAPPSDFSNYQAQAF